MNITVKYITPKGKQIEFKQLTQKEFEYLLIDKLTNIYIVRYDIINYFWKNKIIVWLLGTNKKEYRQHLKTTLLYDLNKEIKGVKNDKTNH